MRRIKLTRVTLNAGWAKHDGRPPFPRNFAGELEPPRMEKRFPTAALTLGQVEALLAVPNLADPLGVRNRAMLEVLYIRQLQEVHPRCHPSARQPQPSPQPDIESQP